MNGFTPAYAYPSVPFPEAQYPEGVTYPGNTILAVGNKGPGLAFGLSLLGTITAWVVTWNIMDNYTKSWILKLIITLLAGGAVGAIGLWGGKQIQGTV